MFVKLSENLSVDFENKVTAETSGSDVVVTFIKTGTTDTTKTINGGTMAQFNARVKAAEGIGEPPIVAET